MGLAASAPDDLADLPAPDRGVQRLANHTPMNRTPLSGGCAVLFGLPFAGAGGMFLGVAAGAFGEQGKNAPDEVIGAMGLTFLLVGLYLMGSGVAGVIARKKFEARALRNPDKEWLIDHPWEEREAKDLNAGGFVGTFAIGGFMALFLLPFNWWAFFSDDGEFMVKAITGFFDFFLVLILGGAFYQLFRWVKYGASRLVFTRCPYVLGDRLDARLHVGVPVDAPELEATLRFVEERVETRQTSEGTSQQVVCYQLYGQTRRVPLKGASRTLDVTLAFPLPADEELATRLSGSPARWWELQVKAETPGIDFDARFLVPVYPPPREG